MSAKISLPAAFANDVMVISSFARASATPQAASATAYLTIANFVFLAAVLWILLFGDSQHAPTTQARGPIPALLRLSGPLPASSPARLLACAPWEGRS